MSVKTSIVTKPSLLKVIGQTSLLPLLIFVLSGITFIVLRFWRIDSFSLWGGEAFTMIGVKQSWSDMFSYVIADIVHPPLFYVLLKLWIALGGESVLWLKLFPVLSSIIILVPFYFLCRELGLELPETSLALFLAAINGYLIHYSQELRMYSLFTCLAMCSFWLFIRFFRSTGGSITALLWLTLINLPLIYSHYYGWLVVGMEFSFLLIWRRQKLLAFGLSMLVLVLAFLPWAYPVIQEARSIGGLERNLGWIPKPGITDLLNFYSTLNGPIGSRYVKAVGLLLFGLPVVVWLWRIVRSGFKAKHDDAILFSWLALLSFLPVIAIFLISHSLEQAEWIDRYFIFISIPYLMLVAAAVYQLERKWMRYTWIALIVLWSSVAGINDLRTNRMAWSSPQLGSRMNWEDLTRRMSEAELSQIYPVNVYTLPVLSAGYFTGDWAISTSLEYHLDTLNDDRFQMVYAKDLNHVMAKEQEDHFWIAYYDIADWRQPSPLPALTDNGFRVGDEIAFDLRGNRLVLLPIWRK